MNNGLKEKAEKEANLPIYEKRIEDQLDVLLDNLRTEVPQTPKSVVRKTVKVKMSTGLVIKVI